jgi:Tol biopolymer transport system component
MSGIVTRLLPAISPMSRVLAPGVMIVLCALVLAAPAHAIYGPAAGGLGAEIVSVDNASDEQGDAATTDAAISANGRYVVFQTRATNFFEDDGVPDGDPEPPGACREGGIFRYDRDTGDLALVADGTEVALNAKGECDPSHLIFSGAESPSVSADGRYVAFDTTQQLVPQDTNENADVYVRDMDVPLGADRKNSGAYTLVSARSGGEEPAFYSPGNPRLPGNESGSQVWPNTSISADGRYVVFSTTEQESDLPDGTALSTPPEQLFVRDLLTKTTTLITRTEAGQEPGPRCGAGGASAGGEPACGAIGPATISADGSTVSWVGTDASAQTRFLPGESLNASEPHYLWRRWQEPGASTRRVTGIADPEDPECHTGEGVTESPLDTGPCYGPLSEPESSLASIALTAPALSADGYTVAFLAGAALRPNITKSRGLDVFLTSMLPGVTRKAGTRELTLAVNSGNPGSTPSIESLALSPDGSTIAFTTSRDAFVLPEPRPLGTFRPVATTADLYVVHLAENTLERAVVDYEDTDPNGSVLNNPTLDQDGSTLAFASAASNLIYGDANGFPDAFTATLQAVGGTAAQPAGVNTGSGGFSLSASASPELGVSVKRAKDGGVILLVETPGPGKLTARARGAIPKVTPTKTSKRAKKASAGAGVFARSSRAQEAANKNVAKKSPPTVLLASASVAARSEGTTTLTLHLSSKYTKDLQRAGKLKAGITIAFAPAKPGESTLTDEVYATFVTSSPVKKTSRKAKAKKA